MVENITLQDVESAWSLVKKYLVITPLVYSPEFSQKSGNQVYFKLENFQRTHAFKARGALNKMSSLSELERKRGVLAASSGNHALGVAFSSSMLGIEATVVMPEHAPAIKIEQAKRYGAKVLLHGETYDEALEYAKRLSFEQEKPLLPSFDDPKVIAGQGTIALEVFDVLPDVDYFVAPIGGGGLISGLLVVIEELKHHAKVIGIQSTGAASMLESIRAGKLVKLPTIKTIADGIAVQQPGRLNFEFAKRYLANLITINDEQIFEGMVRMLWDMRIVVEPAAAAAPAALIFDETIRNLGKTICCVVTGGNISQTLLQQVVSVEYPE